jgi:hypothetical protein
MILYEFYTSRGGILPWMIIFLSRFNLLQFIIMKQRLKYNNYYEQKINMCYFVKATEHNMSIHTKIQD